MDVCLGKKQILMVSIIMKLMVGCKDCLVIFGVFSVNMLLENSTQGFINILVPNGGNPCHNFHKLSWAALIS
jgi:hypothetical protein